jgi:hypothetical protein
MHGRAEGEGEGDADLSEEVTAKQITEYRGASAGP